MNMSVASMRSPSKTNASCLSTKWERGNTSHLLKTTRDLKKQIFSWITEDCRAREHFFWWKTLHNWSNCYQTERKSVRKIFSRHWSAVRTTYRQQTPFFPWCGLPSSNLGSPLFFVDHWVKINSLHIFENILIINQRV